MLLLLLLPFLLVSMRETKSGTDDEDDDAVDSAPDVPLVSSALIICTLALELVPWLKSCCIPVRCFASCCLDMVTIFFASFV